MNYFYNCHVHIFRLQHVPQHFAKGYLTIFGWTPRLNFRKLGTLLAFVDSFLSVFFKNRKLTSLVKRLRNLLLHGDNTSQEEIFQELCAYYPSDTRFIVLPMDMDYMEAGNPEIQYPEQLNELLNIKRNSELSAKIFPFAFADPRRIKSHPEYLNELRTYAREKMISGIKMYPALGYWPFDEALRPVYDLCIEYNLPIMTHTVEGVVHTRGRKLYQTHPITGVALYGHKPRHFARHFSNPINWHFLLNPAIISKYWKISEAEANPYQNLKVCLAHFGGSEQWMPYLKNPDYIGNKPRRSAAEDVDFECLNLIPEAYNFLIKDSTNEYSWFSIIKAMIKKYPNVYSDVSYILYNKELYPMLKVLMLTDKSIKQRLLFGTDYYVVAQKGFERELSVNFRSEMGEELFEHMALKNVEEYLFGKY